MQTRTCRPMVIAPLEVLEEMMRLWWPQDQNLAGSQWNQSTTFPPTQHKEVPCVHEKWQSVFFFFFKSVPRAIPSHYLALLQRSDLWVNQAVQVRSLPFEVCKCVQLPINGIQTSLGTKSGAKYTQATGWTHLPGLPLTIHMILTNLLVAYLRN